MRFLVRTALNHDLEALLSLSKEGFLFNLPAKKETIEKKIQNSQSSFLGKKAKEKAEYLFVLEDLHLKEKGERSIVGSSQILAQLGIPKRPFYSLLVSKEKKRNPFIRKEVEFQIFQLQKNTQGFSELGGLVVLPSYRRHKEKVGRLISFSRFIYMALMKESFQEKVLARMAPLLNEKKENAFWKAFGKRFTHISYNEVLDIFLEEREKEIFALFPKEGERIYACTLNPTSLFTVFGMQRTAYPAFSLLKRMGFKESSSMDPIDGGLFVEAHLEEIEFIKGGKKRIFKEERKKSFFDKEKKFHEAFLGLIREGKYWGGKSVFLPQGEEEILLPEETKRALDLSSGESLYIFEDKE